MSTLTTTIEVEDDFELEVEIEYKAYPGQKPSWGYDGGDPGWPPYADLIGVKVLDGGQGCDLEKVAYLFVQDNWKHFGDMCLEDAGNREEAARDAADEEKFERYRNGDFER